jgi:hypothetical protein
VCLLQHPHEETSRQVSELSILYISMEQHTLLGAKVLSITTFSVTTQPNAKLNVQLMPSCLALVYAYIGQL